MSRKEFYTKNVVTDITGRFWRVKKERHDKSVTDTYPQTDFSDALGESENGITGLVKRVGLQTPLLNMYAKNQKAVVDYLKDRGWECYLSQGRYLKCQNDKSKSEVLGFGLCFGNGKEKANSKDSNKSIEGAFLAYYDFVENQIISENLIGRKVDEVCLSLIDLWTGKMQRSDFEISKYASGASNEDEIEDLADSRILEKTLDALKKIEDKFLVGEDSFDQDLTTFQKVVDIVDDSETIVEFKEKDGISREVSSNFLDGQDEDNLKDLSNRLIGIYNRHIKDSDSDTIAALRYAFYAEMNEWDILAYNAGKEGVHGNISILGLKKKFGACLNKSSNKETVIDEICDMLGGYEKSRIKRTIHIVSNNVKLDAKKVHHIEQSGECIYDVYYLSEGSDTRGKIRTRRTMTETEILTREFLYLVAYDQMYIRFIIDVQIEDLPFERENVKQLFKRRTNPERFNETHTLGTRTHNKGDKEDDGKPLGEWAIFGLAYAAQKNRQFNFGRFVKNQPNINHWLRFMFNISDVGGKDGYKSIIDRNWQGRYRKGHELFCERNNAFYEVLQSVPLMLVNILTEEYFLPHRDDVFVKL